MSIPLPLSFTCFWFPSFHSPKSNYIITSDSLHLRFVFGLCDSFNLHRKLQLHFKLSFE